MRPQQIDIDTFIRGLAEAGRRLAADMQRAKAALSVAGAQLLASPVFQALVKKERAKERYQRRYARGKSRPR